MVKIRPTTGKKKNKREKKKKKAIYGSKTDPFNRPIFINKLIQAWFQKELV